jgi:hypothetical protein
MSDNGSGPSADSSKDPTAPSDDIDELRDQIEATRDELAHTVEALAAKADVKGRAQDKVGELKSQASAQAAHVRDTTVQNAQVAATKVSETAASVNQTVTRTVSQTNAERPWLLPAVAGGVVAAFAGVWILIRRRNS